MKKVIEKLHKELSQYLSDVEKSSPSHILLESYQIEMKCHLVSAMIYIADNGMLPEAVWTHLLVQNCPLDYLYELWMNDPNTLTPELAEIMKPVLEKWLPSSPVTMPWGPTCSSGGSSTSTVLMNSME